MPLAFARPDALWLLLLLPAVAALGWWRGVRPGRLSRSALGLRLVTVALLAATLAQPLVATGAGRASTVFVVDRSQSLAPETAGAAANWVNQAAGAAGDGDRAAVVAFGASPAVAAPAGPARQLDPAWASANAAVDPAYTDIGGGLALARALPLGGARRIVLLSDGAENVGSALDQAAQAAADGVPIDVVPLPGVGVGDLRIDGATIPSSAWQGEPVSLLASVSTGNGGPGRLEVWVDGRQVAAQDVVFPAGLSSHAFALTDLGPGFHAVEVRVSGVPGDDRFAENDRLPLAVVVHDRPSLLLVTPPDSDSGALAAALGRNGAQVTDVPPSEVPSRISELGQYDAFVLDNVAAAALTLDQMAGLQEATRTLGRGLVVVGGTSAYGPGAYAGTVLEDVLPVTVRVTDGRQRQKVALLLIVDKSGSMSYDPLGSTGKIEMARQAVQLAADSLSIGDEVGVIAFNDRQEWVVPMTEIDSEATRQAIDAKIAGIASDGGTEILPALAAGLDAIRNVPADVRHIVLLSDGKSRSGTRENYAQLLADAASDHVTVSTIAIGQDADTDLLNYLADLGGGRYHYTEKPEDIPTLALQEAQSAGSQSVIRGQFQAIQTAPSPILADFPPGKLPPLSGYDFAQAKPDAQVILTSGRGDPVLAKWQYGLGRAVAWTADDGVDFASGWTGWDGYADFWDAMVRWVLPDPENRPLTVDVARQGPQALITVADAGADGDAGGPATTTATITAPGGAALADQPLTQVGPGQYQLRVDAPTSGAYRIDVTQERNGQTLRETAGFAVPPSPELQPAPDGDALLRAIAARTGGRVLSLDDASDVFVGGGAGAALRELRPVWPVPLALALLALLAEIAERGGAVALLRSALRRGPLGRA